MQINRNSQPVVNRHSLYTLQEFLIQYYLQVTLKHSRLELKKMQNKDIEKKFKEKIYELHVTKAIDKDIRDYAVALEKCLMEFHREKMENINLIIK